MRIIFLLNDVVLLVAAADKASPFFVDERDIRPVINVSDVVGKATFDDFGNQRIEFYSCNMTGMVAESRADFDSAAGF